MKKIYIVFLVFIILSSCALFQNDSSGKAVIRIAEQTSNRILLPGLDMNINSCDIYGTGPGGETFTLLNITEENITVASLAPGTWTITVNGKNAGGVVIGRGEATIVVHTGETSEITIIINPLDGSGVLDLSVLWNAGDTDIPSIESEIIPSSGTGLIYPDFTISDSGDKGTYRNESMLTGYYTVIIKLMDNGLLTMGAVEVARIVQNEVTSGTFEFFDINIYGGSITAHITPEMNNPVIITLSGTKDEIYNGETMTVQASTPSETGTMVYMWYLNGSIIQATPSQGSSTCLISGLDPGYYRLDVTAFTADGKRGGSASHTFTVLPAFGEVKGVIGTMDSLNFTPLEGARVEAGGQSTYTNSSGEFLLTGVPSGERVLSASLAGYLTGYENLTIPNSAGVDAGIIALMKAEKFTFSSQTGITLTTNNGLVQMTIPANSLVYENGQTYTGEVLARLNGATPQSPGFENLFPGNFEGTTTGGQTAPLISQGFIYPELFSAGTLERLDLGEELAAVIRINARNTEILPAIIPTWFFDTGTGQWIEKGRARLINNQFVATIREIRPWNVDIPRLVPGSVTGIAGMIEGAEFVPLANVQVAGDGIKTTTDNGGYFTIKELPGGMETVISFSADGFLTGYKTAYVLPGSEMNIGKVVLLNAERKEFSTDEGVTLYSGSGSASITIPPGALIDETGQAYSGKAVALFNAIIPGEPGFEEAFPGDFLGIASMGNETRLISLGFVYPVIYALESGSPLQLRPGMTAEIIVSATNPDAPTEVPLWYFNNTNGVWIESGRVRLEGRVFIGKIEEILIYNIDIPVEIFQM